MSLQQTCHMKTKINGRHANEVYDVCLNKIHLHISIGRKINILSSDEKGLSIPGVTRIPSALSYLVLFSLTATEVTASVSKRDETTFSPYLEAQSISIGEMLMP